MSEMTVRIIEGGVNTPKGFRTNGVACGLKEKETVTKDVGVILSEVPCVTSCTFTGNQVKAAPVHYDMARRDNAIQAVIVNSGNANCLTGQTGMDNAAEMARMTEEGLGLSRDSVLVCSTGVIGRKLNMDRVKYGVEKVCNLVKKESELKNFAHAIMTTDMKMKTVAYEFELSGKTVTIGATAKGAGMIKPQMALPHATMLVFISTDAAISKPMLDKALGDAVEFSFNRISVDNDTSTNDTVIIMANGKAENPEITADNEDFKLFKRVLVEVCQTLGKLMVKDGEGATKCVHIVVKGAATSADAEKAARAVADSYLVKTAMFGQSPNFGRILAALGYSGAKFDLEKTTLFINDLAVFENGQVNRSAESLAPSEMIPNDIRLTLDLGVGKKEYFVWTSDLSYDYVKINAHYIS